MWPNLQETADVVTFTEEILNGNFIFCAMKTEHIPESTVWSVIMFDLNACPRQGLLKYIRTKMLTTCFFTLYKAFWKTKRDLELVSLPYSLPLSPYATFY